MSAASSTANLLARLERWLEIHRPDYSADLQPGASDADLDALETRFTVQLPEAFRALYRWRNGHQGETAVPGPDGHLVYRALPYNDSLVSNRMFMPLQEIAGVKQDLDEMIGYDIEEGRWRRTWIPFLSNGGGDYMCVDLTDPNSEEYGQILQAWHDDDGPTQEHSSLQAWLEALVHSMEGGTYELA